MSKLLYYNDLSDISKVVSKIVTLFFLYTIYTILLLLFTIYSYYLITLLYIYYNINELGVGSKVIFCCNYLATLLFLFQKSCCTGVFVLVFTSIYGKIEKNLPIFCNFFSLIHNKLEES